MKQLFWLVTNDSFSNRLTKTSRLYLTRYSSTFAHLEITLSPSYHRSRFSRSELQTHPFTTKNGSSIDMFISQMRRLSCSWSPLVLLSSDKGLRLVCCLHVGRSPDPLSRHYSAETHPGHRASRHTRTCSRVNKQRACPVRVVFVYCIKRTKLLTSIL